MKRPLTIAERAAVAAAFVAAVRQWRANHHRDAVAAALAAATGVSRKQRRDAAVATLDHDRLRADLHVHVAPHLDHLYGRAWSDAYTRANRRGGVPYTTVPDPQPFIAARIDQLVASSVDAATFAAGAVIASGVDPWAAAGVVLAAAGLNRPQATSVVNLHRALTTPPKVAEGQPVPKMPVAGVVERRERRMADQKLRRRATLVGWYEPGFAVQTARLDAWRYYGSNAGFADMAADGRVPAQEWVVGANPCDDCARMAGTRIGIYDEFPGGGPPRHPSCQCDRVLVEVYVGREAAAAALAGMSSGLVAA